MLENNSLNTRHIFIFLIIAFLLAVTIAAATIGDVWTLLSTATDTATTSSASGLEIVTSNGLDELAVLRGCATDEVLKMNSSNLWACAEDSTTSVTGAGVVLLDLSDDAANESSALSEIATTGDTNSIFTEPSADKLLIAVGSDWPKADLADALAANPTDCAATQFAISIVASGNLTCAQPAFTDLSGSATDAQIPNTITIDLAATATALAANGANCAAASYPLGVDASGAAESCTVAQYQTVQDEGGGLTQRITLNFAGAGVACADDTTRTTCTIAGGGSANSFETMNVATGSDPVADSASDTLNLIDSATISVTGTAASDELAWHLISPTCTDTSGQHLNYSGTVLTCGTSTSGVTDVTGGAGIASTGGTTPSISTASGETDFLASGALLCGAGTQGRMQVHTTPLQYCDNDGGDTLRYAAYGSPTGVATTATALAANGANCSAGNAPLGVDASGASESCFDVEEEGQINATDVDGNSSDDTVLLGTGASVAKWATVPNCTDASGSHLNYTAATNAFSCGTSTSGVTSVTGGAGIASSGGATPDITTASGETDFLASGDLTCGVGTQGRMQVHTTPLQYCDNDGGDTRRYAAYGSSTGVATSATVLAANGANCSAGQAPLGVDASGASETCTAFLSTGGRGLTVTTGSTGSDVFADVELYTHTKTINILNPTTSETNKVQFTIPLAATIQRVWCSTDVGTLTMQLDERAEGTPNAAGTNVLTSSLVCDTSTEATATFSNATIASRVPVNLQITATASTPTIVRIHVEFTYDD